MEEVWKDIEGYEGLYQVSNFGRVRTLKIMKPAKLKKGYLYLTLSRDNKKKCTSVHRLVAKAFIHNPRNYPQVNHIDGNKENNNINNLEWCDNSFNQKEAYKLGYQKPRRHYKTAYKVNQYNLEGDYIKQWESVASIERELGYSKASISGCCNGIYKKAHGYIWKYVYEKPEQN